MENEAGFMRAVRDLADKVESLAAKHDVRAKDVLYYVEREL